MVRASRRTIGRRAVSAVGVLGFLVLVVGLVGCASPCGPCDPCDPAPSVCAPCPSPCAPPCDIPPEAKAGEAWCRVWVPASYATQADTVCVKPACRQKVWIPPKYGTRPKLVCCEEPQLRERVVPAVWAVTSREREVCPPQEQWQRVCCPQGDLEWGEVQCECWTKCVRPPVCCEEPCPVCLAPERRCVHYTPAEYEVGEERFLIEPGRCEDVCIPAVFEQRCRDVCVCPGRWEWRHNVACEVPVCAPPPVPATYPAIQVEMEDNGPAGEECGVFGVNDIVRYDLRVLSDAGSQALSGLKAVFSIPPELEFISGGGQGVAVAGAGQSAESGTFDLPVGANVSLHILCRVVAVPASNLLQLTAAVRHADGTDLAVETESTTVKP